MYVFIKIVTNKFENKILLELLIRRKRFEGSGIVSLTSQRHLVVERVQNVLFFETAIFRLF